MKRPADQGFVAQIRLNEQGQSQDSATVTRSGNRISMAARDLQVEVTLTGKLTVLHDTERKVAIILDGSLWCGVRGAQLLERYQQRGMDFVGELCGSFALLLLDGAKGECWLANDRFSSRPVYVKPQGRGYSAGTIFTDLVTAEDEPDPGGVAWYLAVGVVFGGRRTVVRGISRLPVGSRWLVKPGDDIRPEEYWRLVFTDEYAGRDRAVVRDELQELLLETIRQTLPTDEEIVLSLSAGYDAAGIAGLLAQRKNHDNVRTFAYGLDPGAAGSDPAGAAALAQQLGLPYRFLQTYDGDLLGALRRNADWGEGRANFCDESLAWDQLAAEDAGKGAWLVTGEQCFGNREVLRPLHDEIMRLRLKFSLQLMPWLQQVFVPDVLAEAGGEQMADIEWMGRRARERSQPENLKLYLYLDQRLPNLLMPWRDSYGRRVYQLVMPWLANDLFDFMARLPLRWRYEKLLYIEAISGLLPEVFATPRAEYCGYAPDWMGEFASGQALVREAFWAGGTTNRLDRVISPKAALQQLRSSEEPSGLVGRGLRLAKRLGARMTGGSVPTLPTAGQRSVFLLRYLSLRGFFNNQR